ncbi:hypothetical protein LPN04_29830 [Rugamonas sp. A1-17]|nr:hypothetical protein [Rugamonas sp. A1-17]
MIAEIMKQMTSIIKSNNYRVQELYPRDLQHDRVILERCATVGALIAWAVGDSHTHMVVLGLEPQQNEMVSCFTNLNSGDKFYLIQIAADGPIFTERTRAQFESLSNTPIPYTRIGHDHEFIIQKHGARIAQCVITRTGTYENTIWDTQITTTLTLSKLDRAALEYWCHRAVATSTGSLFFKSEVTWHVPKVASHRDLLKQTA